MSDAQSMYEGTVLIDSEDIAVIKEKMPKQHGNTPAVASADVSLNRSITSLLIVNSK